MAAGRRPPVGGEHRPRRAPAAGRAERCAHSTPEERVARGAQDRRATPVRNAHSEARTGEDHRERDTGDDNGHGKIKTLGAR